VSILANKPKSNQPAKALAGNILDAFAWDGNDLW
jgi:hypothetical protein